MKKITIIILTLCSSVITAQNTNYFYNNSNQIIWTTDI